MGAVAKTSMAALEETRGQFPEAGLGVDHFTLKIMYLSKGSPSRGEMFIVMFLNPTVP